jgi:hypothetical protein
VEEVAESAEEVEFDLDSDRTALEDHIAQQSPLQQMAQDSRRIDDMPDPVSSPGAEGSHLLFSELGGALTSAM